MTPSPTRIRAHHLLCLQGFRGQGYSPAFVENFRRLLSELNGRPERECEVVVSTDDFCAPCPHRKGGLCAKDASADRRVRGLDARVLAELSLDEGAQAPFEELVARVNARFRTRVGAEPICGTCEWRTACAWYGGLPPA